MIVTGEENIATTSGVIYGSEITPVITNILDIF